MGTPKGRRTRLEQSLLAQPWAEARESVQVKLLEPDGELSVLARSDGRADKKRAMRRRRLTRLQELCYQLTRDQLLLKRGAAKNDAGRADGLVNIQPPEATQPVTPDTFHFSMCQATLRQIWSREGCYLLRSHLTATDPAILWQYDIQLTEIEQALQGIDQ